MDKIDLPYMDQSMSLEQAFHTMCDAGAHAIIVRHTLPESRNAVSGNTVWSGSNHSHGVEARMISHTGTGSGAMSVSQQASLNSASKVVYRLYHNHEIVEGLHNGLTTCSELSEPLGNSILVINNLNPAVDPLAYNQPYLENQMDQGGEMYAVVKPPEPSKASSLRIITRHEDLKNAIENAQSICVCCNKPAHKAEPLTTESKCRVCDKPVRCDNNTLNCP